ncbi:MAG: hypothetical protein R3C11_05360 [Planctomycetaceae bacterium]
MSKSNQQSETYTQHGLQITYPANWTLEESVSTEEIQIVIQRPTSAFWVMTLYFERPGTEDLIESAIEAYRGEYGQVDEQRSEKRVGEHVATAVDLEFICLDLPTTVTLQAFATDRFTALILARIRTRPESTASLVREICNSIQCEEDFFGFTALNP